MLGRVWPRHGHRGRPLNSVVSRHGMARLKHELWKESEQEQTFCLSGPMGDEARSVLGPGAKLIWTVEAESHVEAMTKYYTFMGWGLYQTEHEWDHQPYSEEWLAIQRSGKVSP